MVGSPTFPQTLRGQRNHDYRTNYPPALSFFFFLSSNFLPLRAINRTSDLPGAQLTTEEPKKPKGEKKMRVGRRRRRRRSNGQKEKPVGKEKEKGEVRNVAHLHTFGGGKNYLSQREFFVRFIAFPKKV